MDSQRESSDRRQLDLLAGARSIVDSALGDDASTIANDARAVAQKLARLAASAGVWTQAEADTKGSTFAMAPHARSAGVVDDGGASGAKKRKAPMHDDDDVVVDGAGAGAGAGGEQPTETSGGEFTVRTAAYYVEETLKRLALRKTLNEVALLIDEQAQRDYVQVAMKGNVSAASAIVELPEKAWRTEVLQYLKQQGYEVMVVRPLCVCGKGAACLRTVACRSAGVQISWRAALSEAQKLHNQAAASERGGDEKKAQ